jgi:L-iditol 2-dehydrogenase
MPRPEPQPNEVLVEIEAAGICGTDIEVLHGNHTAYLRGIAGYPITPGHEWSGIVRATGSEVARFAPGELVTGETGIGCLRCELCLSGRHNLCRSVVETGIFNRDGGMREWHVQPETFTHPAAGLTPEQAALVEPASVAVHACRQGQVGARDNVAVLGCGPIGLLTIQAARVFGARNIIATSRSAPKLRLAEELGADRAVNTAKEDPVAAAFQMTAGEGPDVVIDCSGSLEAVGQAFDMAAPRGRIVIAAAYRREPFTHEIDCIIGRELTVVGSCGSPHAYPETIDMIRRGQVKVEPVISHWFPLTAYAEAFALAERGGPNVLKVLLLPESEG